MNTAYLEVTYHQGKLVAAYYYLPRLPEQRSVRTRRVEPGLLIDYAKDGRPIGVEITASATSRLRPLIASCGSSAFQRLAERTLRLSSPRNCVRRFGAS
jgi:uncharacterized protein YuzE